MHSNGGGEAFIQVRVSARPLTKFTDVVNKSSLFIVFDYDQLYFHFDSGKN